MITKHQFVNPTNQEWLIENYFSSQSRELQLIKGEPLLIQDQPNDRLFWVKQGRFTGYSVDEQGSEYEILRAHSNMFVGIASFFSCRQVSMMTVVADMDSTVRYIEREQEFIQDGHSLSMADQFQDVIINELVHRQAHLFKMTVEREKTLKMLAHHEKMATLGKISAGIAHELNNAIAVLKRNAEWVSQHISSYIESSHPDFYSYAKTGLEKGRCVSSSDARKITKALSSKFRADESRLKKIAAMGRAEDETKKLIALSDQNFQSVYDYWETGASLKDMLVASEHATHVVKSIKALGAPQSERQSGLILNQCVEEAATLLSSSLRKVNVKLSLRPVPGIFANKGEWVEIFMNLMQNACDSLIASNTEEPLVEVLSEEKNGRISITVFDNGPGIPPSLLPRIFDPSITTKSSGLTFGLGLGLTIVERLVERYHGTISVRSEPGNTRFCIDVPSGGNE